MTQDWSSGKLALLVGGGPAPGINGVINSVTIAAINGGKKVVGIQDGFQMLVKSDLSRVRNLEIDDVKAIHLRGGSILGTSRVNPAKSEADMKSVLACFRELDVNMLVTIGGDDTAYSASQVYARAGGAIRVAHVPKTIDNDLPLPQGVPTFGFETARHLGASIVRNIMEDGRTTSRWYLIVSMGRAAGHLALGIGMSAAATLTIIPEEFRGQPLSLNHLCDLILGSIIKRRANNRPYGVAVLAEGLLETIGEQGFSGVMDDSALGKYGKVQRDPHGHLRLGEIEFGRIIKDHLTVKLEELGLKVSIIDKDLGYELRCADPIPFDAEYTRALGYGAVKFLQSEDSTRFGGVMSLVGGRLQSQPFHEIMNPETKRMLPRKVDVDGEAYECARHYMIRLVPSDFESAEKLGRLASIVNMTPEQFIKRFGYLVGL
ncbi:MAG TPA: diphosphate--fructose-6-phosphate 1-phosphotransferase [Gemmataceae bacterium]|jgi:6-phosphofructokinase 1|nr:diphosphate--fructose-6-phosphate 1-phosphotransferase [Gemmataceae bacterium]